MVSGEYNPDPLMPQNRLGRYVELVERLEHWGEPLSIYNPLSFDKIEEEVIDECLFPEHYFLEVKKMYEKIKEKNKENPRISFSSDEFAQIFKKKWITEARQKLLDLKMTLEQVCLQHITEECPTIHAYLNRNVIYTLVRAGYSLEKIQQLPEKKLTRVRRLILKERVSHMIESPADKITEDSGLRDHKTISL